MGIFSASCSLGAAQASIEAAVDHVKVRKQFSKPLASFQVLYNGSGTIFYLYFMKLDNC